METVHALAHSAVCDRMQIQQEVVTSHSQVTVINIDTNERQTFCIALGDNDERNWDNISAFDQVCFQILGSRVGDAFDWPVPGGVRRFSIAEIRLPLEFGERSVC